MRFDRTNKLRRLCQATLLIAAAALRAEAGPIGPPSGPPFDPSTVILATTTLQNKTFNVPSATIANLTTSTANVTKIIFANGSVITSSPSFNPGLYPATGTIVAPFGISGSTLAFSSGTYSAHLTVGGTTITGSAVFEATAPNKGILVPRLTTTQRNAISAPATSLLVFNTTVGDYQYYDGSGWVSVSTGTLTIGTANGLSLSGTVLSLGFGSTTSTGAIKPADWNTFNGKLDTDGDGSALTGLTKAQVGLSAVQNVDQTNATNLTTGTVNAARLGSSPNASKYLAGDSTWKVLNSTAVGLGNVTNDAQVKRSDYSAKGVILAGTVAGFSPLSAGPNLYMLISDSSQLTGVRWAPSAQSNSIYPATATASFPVGFSASTATITNLTVTTETVTGLFATSATVTGPTALGTVSATVATIGTTTVSDQLTVGLLSGVLKASAGVVSGAATTSNVPEGSNLYFTTARATGSISATAPITYASGVVGIDGSFVSSTTLASTYLAQSSATATYLQKSSATAVYLQLSSATANYVSKSSAAATYFQPANATTSNLPEGTNLYYTTARATTAISATSPLANTNGTIAMPAATSSQNGYLTSTDWTTFNAKAGLSSTNTWTAAQTFPAITASTANFKVMITTDPYIDVRAFGAVCDDVHDDYPNIQAALDYAGVWPWKTVIIPPGTCRSAGGSLLIGKSIRLIGTGGTVENNDSDYIAKAGAPSSSSAGSVIHFASANVPGLIIGTNTASALGYKIQVQLENLNFFGDTEVGHPNGHGIVVNTNDVNFAARCIFKNIGVANVGGYGIWLKQGFYGSYFENISIYYSGYTGFRVEGTNQGEWKLDGLRAFGPGDQGTTEDEKAGVYVLGGAGITMNRLSVQAYGVHIYLKSATISGADWHCESFPVNQASDRSLIVESGSLTLNGSDWAPNGNFLGKVVDFRDVHKSNLFGINNFSTIDSSGYFVYLDTNSADNVVEIQGDAAGLARNSIPTGNGNLVGPGASAFTTNPIFIGTATFPAGTFATPSLTIGTSGNGIFAAGVGRIDFGFGGTSNPLSCQSSGCGFELIPGTLNSGMATYFHGDTGTGFYNVPAQHLFEFATNLGRRFEIGTTSVTVVPPLYAGSGPTQLTDSVGNLQATALTGTVPNASIDTSSITKQANTFNGNSQLVQTTSGGLLPALSAANLTSIPAANLTGTIAAISGVNVTNLNASNLGSGTVPAAQMPALTGDVTTSAGAVATTVSKFSVTAGTATTLSATTIQNGGMTDLSLSTSGVETKGIANGSTAAAGMRGEVIESVVGFTNAPSQATLGDLTSVSLSPGRWLVSANVMWLRSGATYTSTDLEIAVTATSGNSSTGVVNGSNMAEFTPGSSALLTWSDLSMAVPAMVIYVPSGANVPYYLKLYPGGYSSGTPQAAGRLTAVRL